MTLSPEKAGAGFMRYGGRPNLALAAVDPGVYTPYNAVAAPKSGWIAQPSSGAFVAFYKGPDGRGFTLEAGVEKTTVIEIGGTRLVALAAPTKRHKSGRGGHYPNIFTGLSDFVPADKVAFSPLPTIAFKTPELAAQTYFSVFSCDNVAVYRLDAANQAFVAVGHKCSAGYFLLGSDQMFTTIEFAEKKLGLLVKLDTFVATFPFLGVPVNSKTGLPTTSAPPAHAQSQKSAQPILMRWNAREGKWFRHNMVRCKLGTTVQVAAKSIVFFRVSVLSPYVTPHSKVTAVVRETETYDFSSPALFKTKPAKTYTCKVVRGDKGVDITLCFAFSSALELHRSKTWPYLACTLMVDTGVAIRTYIGRHWHTCPLRGLHYRTTPKSLGFALVPTLLVHTVTTSANAELARILPEDLKWLGEGDARLKSGPLLSLVRSEELKESTPDTIVAVLKPGEAAVTLALLRSLVVAGRVFNVRKYPDSAMNHPLPPTVRQKLADGRTKPHTFTFVTMPDDLKL